MVLGLLPPPPVFVELRDRVNQTSQLLTWTGQGGIRFVFILKIMLMLLIPFLHKSNLQFCNLNVFAFCKLIFPDERMIIESFNSNVKTFCVTGESQMAIIHFLMEFRLRPLAGSGEDWVSLVIPFNSAVRTQSYLLRGLSPGTQHSIYWWHSTLKISPLSFILSSGTHSIEEVFPCCFQFRVDICLSGFKLRIKFIPAALSPRVSAWANILPNALGAGEGVAR